MDAAETCRTIVPTFFTDTVSDFVELRLTVLNATGEGSG